MVHSHLDLSKFTSVAPGQETERTSLMLYQLTLSYKKHSYKTIIIYCKKNQQHQKQQDFNPLQQ